MSQQSWQELLMSVAVDGTALNTSVTPTSILPAAGKLVFPANYFQINKVIRVRAYGRISNIVTPAGNLTLDLRLGAIVVANGGTMALNAVAKTNVPWFLEFVLTCRAIGNGTTANFMPQGIFQSESVIGSPANTAGGNGSLLIPVGAPVVGNGFDSTAAQTLDLFATFSTSNVGNNIQLHQFLVESLN